MDSAGRWFDAMTLADEVRVRVGRENAHALFSLGLKSLPAAAAIGMGA